MFDRPVFAFYWADSIENCEVIFSYHRESKSNSCDFFKFFLWCYQLIMIRKHGAISFSVMKQIDRDKIHNNG